MEGDRSEREGGGLRRVARRGAIVLAWLALWQLAALAVGNALLLCGPAEAAAALARNLADPAFWTATARSFERIALGFAAPWGWPPAPQPRAGQACATSWRRSFTW